MEYPESNAHVFKLITLHSVDLFVPAKILGNRLSFGVKGNYA